MQKMIAIFIFFKVYSLTNGHEHKSRRYEKIHPSMHTHSEKLKSYTLLPPPTSKIQILNTTVLFTSQPSAFVKPDLRTRAFLLLRYAYYSIISPYCRSSTNLLKPCQFLFSSHTLQLGIYT